VSFDRFSPREGDGSHAAALAETLTVLSRTRPSLAADLHEFRKAFSRVTQKLARPATPIQPEVADPPAEEVFTPFTAINKGSPMVVQPEKAAAYFTEQARDVGAWEVHLANKASESALTVGFWTRSSSEYSLSLAVSTLRQMKERDIVIS
jgi:hypothetical protein